MLCCRMTGEVKDKAIVESEKKEVMVEKVEEKKEVAAPVRKELSGLPAGLLEKIQAKEAAKRAAELVTDKGKEERAKQLRRLPAIARLLRNIYISERKAALPHPIILKKVVASYPGHIAQEVLSKDIEKLCELNRAWRSEEHTSELPVTL